MTWKPSFATVIMEYGVSGFTDTLRQWGVELREDRLFVGERLVAICRFEDLSARDAKLGAWCRVGARPIVGAPSRLFAWTHAPLSMHDTDELGTLVRAITHASLGAVLSIDEDELREMVVERTFRLSNLNHQYGFDDGDALLERTPGPYIDHVIERIRGVLARERIEIWVGLDTDGRDPNPLRTWPPMTRAGVDVPAEEVDRILYGLDVTIWAFRDGLFNPRDSFWYE